ncbi:hypothetical protein COU00_03820 [Candidatus Falkowbacteria bacterium CG10_big_fil_rev_8_21_14_0_10_43_11]|uniref:Uncharacterized protein n=1 Tax=Candidatus Falkowbacteria bacterium CG10_big_fil_rev_8_21_14_0_10_43_11 TaxID=1974568 RepID=A0A2M6WL60_9BACT|nr:MAG: hypothetical protein COU00_03820 [Candidatus Falkowbacteria bacterium CG10_big_fil_rev_8_21_14_0_10_43_11]
MERLKRILETSYWLALLSLATYAFTAKLTNVLDLAGIFHLAYYLPAIAMLLVISGHIDLLSSIQKNSVVNLKARIYDFTHWMMLIGINIGARMTDGVTIWWFVLKLILLAIIGWQIGIGIKNRLRLTMNDRIAGTIFAVSSFLVGLIAGYIRSIDQTPLGWGWAMETSTAVIATLIVFKWIQHDIKTISECAIGYPRKFFLKGIFGNFLVFWFWLHIMVNSGFDGMSWLRYFGLSFNVLIGNLLFFIYWLIYEYHRKKQQK